MKVHQTLAQRLSAVRGRARDLLLVPVVAVMCSPVYAGLPTMPTPGPDMQGNTCAPGAFMCEMSAWFRSGLIVLGLVLLGLSFLYVVGGALTKWREYTTGRAQIGDLKEYFIMGMVLVVFLTLLVTYAFQVIGNT
ncbi:MAG: DUF2976 domain-containing protein [Hydrogenophaga sp.]